MSLAAERIAAWTTLLLQAEATLAAVRNDPEPVRRAARVAKGEHAVAQAKERLGCWQKRLEREGRAA